MNAPFATDLPADGGMHRWNQPIEYYILILTPFVHSRDVAKLIGDLVLEIQPYSSFIGWCFNGANVYGLEEGTEIIMSWGEYVGYTAVITSIHVDNFMHMVDFAVTTEENTPILIRDVGFFDLWELYGALVKFDCNSDAVRLTHEQFDHCVEVRHVI